MLYRQYFTPWAGAALLVLGLAAAGAVAVITPAQAPIAYFRIGTRNGREQLLSPGGNPFHLRALAGLRLESPREAANVDLTPVEVDRRSTAILTAMQKLGFNAIGAESDADLWQRGTPYIQSLDLTSHLAAEQQLATVNVYDPRFVAEVEQWAQSACAPRASDRTLIGYLSDAVLNWGSATQAPKLLAFYLGLPPDSPGRQRTDDYLRIRYGSNIQKLDRAWSIKARDFIGLSLPPAGNAAANRAFAQDATPFANRVLARYLQTTANAIHAADPNHLFLGAGLSADSTLSESDAAATSAPADTNATLIWQIADVATVTFDGAESPALVAEHLRRLTPRPIILRIPGCEHPPATLPAALTAPGVIGYVWAPESDWDSPACAPALEFWTMVNAGKRE